MYISEDYHPVDAW